MGDPTYANLTTEEGILTGEIAFNWDIKVGRLTIMNDSGTADLRWKLHENEDYATLYPTETISLAVRTRTLWLSSTNGQYRVWGLG